MASPEDKLIWFICVVAMVWVFVLLALAFPPEIPTVWKGRYQGRKLTSCSHLLPDGNYKVTQDKGEYTFWALGRAVASCRLENR